MTARVIITRNFILYAAPGTANIVSRKQFKLTSKNKLTAEKG